MKLRYIFLVALCAIFALQFSVSTAQITVFPTYTEDFEASNGGWSGTGSWAWGSPTGASITSAAQGTKCWKTSLTGNYTNSETSYMTSPIFDFSCLSADPTLTFNIAHYLESGYDYGIVQLSTNGGSTWVTLGSTSSGGTNWYQTASGWNGSRTWVTASHVLTGMAGKSSVMIRIRLSSDSSVVMGGIGIDLVTINLAGATLGTPTLSAPADFAIGVAISPTLTWNSTTCATAYDVQVATDVSFTNIVTNITGNASTSLAVGPLAGSTVHYWRVRATRGGIISGWSSVRAFTTIFPPPPAPVLIVPANNATAQTLAPNLTWLPAVGASSYKLQVSTSPAFSTFLIDSSLAGLNASLKGLQNYTVYYWRVSASNTSGTSPFSTVWNFRTLLASTTLSLPLDATIELTLPPTLQWANIPGLVGYRLQVASDVTFNTIVYDNPSILAPSASVPNLQNNTQYFWRVKCIGTGNEESDWSLSKSFSTIITTPSLNLPFDGAKDQPINVSVSWGAVFGQPKYQIQVATTVIFTAADMVFDSVIASGTTVPPSRLANNTTYFWRVRGVSTINGKGLWSDVHSFSTIVSSTTLIFPVDQTKGQSIPINLQWASVGAKAIYQIQISTDNTFKTTVIDEDKIGGNSVLYNEFNGLKNNMEYYWRVRPTSQSGFEVPWSPTWSFTTVVGTPVLTAPKNGQQNLQKSINLAWTDVEGSTSFMIQIAKDSKFVDIVSDLKAVTGTSKIVELETDTKYYWRMRASSTNNGTGNWSETWNFVTGSQAATIPALNSPEDKAKNVIPNVRLTWKDAPGAATYDLQISRTADFKNVLANESGLTATSYTTNGLAAKETYFWRVQSVNQVGASGWSDPWSFTVVVGAPATVSLLLPAKNAKNQLTTSASLKWENVTEAESYAVQLSENSNFGTTDVDVKDITTNTYTVSKLKSGTEYFWRVKAINAGGEGAWSETWNFTTETSNGVVESPELGISLLSYPNPMATSAGTLELVLQQRSNVRVTLISLLGVESIELMNGMYEAGKNTAEWSSVGLSSGMYFIRLETTGKVLTIPVTIVSTK
ncbi:MAG: fibronectin type III domain-containing protein [Ignavibacteriae bacterium]|nr:fibronectin type III domain-containing protein [Ignavibacteriota bacterium]